MRRESSSGVREILRVLDRATASPHNGGDYVMVNVVASSIIEHGDTIGHFTQHTKKRWTPEGLRAVVLAFALHAPGDEYRSMVLQARRQLAWIEWWDAEGHAEAMGGVGDRLADEQAAAHERSAA